jgi:hypothetical protein
VLKLLTSAGAGAGADGKSSGAAAGAGAAGTTGGSEAVGDDESCELKKQLPSGEAAAVPELAAFRSLWRRHRSFCLTLQRHMARAHMQQDMAPVQWSKAFRVRSAHLL